MEFDSTRDCEHSLFCLKMCARAWYGSVRAVKLRAASCADARTSLLATKQFAPGGFARARAASPLAHSLSSLIQPLTVATLLQCSANLAYTPAEKIAFNYSDPGTNLGKIKQPFSLAEMKNLAFQKRSKNSRLHQRANHPYQKQ